MPKLFTLTSPVPISSPRPHPPYLACAAALFILAAGTPALAEEPAPRLAETEALVRRVLEAKSGGPKEPAGRVDPDIQRLENELSEKLGARVAIQHGARGRGKLVVAYTSLDELDGIIAHIR